MSDDKKADALDDLRSTSDAVLEEVDHVRRIEKERAQLPASDPRRQALDHEASRSAHQLKDEARAETELAEELGPDG